MASGLGDSVTGVRCRWGTRPYGEEPQPRRRAAARVDGDLVSRLPRCRGAHRPVRHRVLPGRRAQEAPASSEGRDHERLALLRRTSPGGLLSSEAPGPLHDCVRHLLRSRCPPRSRVLVPDARVSSSAARTRPHQDIMHGRASWRRPRSHPQGLPCRLEQGRVPSFRIQIGLRVRFR